MGIRISVAPPGMPPNRFVGAERLRDTIHLVSLKS
jgi:hypothetical protein